MGAALVADGQVVARAHNRVEASGDATAHAELLVIQQACPCYTSVDCIAARS